MKKILYMAFVAAIALTSCQKEDNLSSDFDNVVRVTTSVSQMQTRAVGSPTNYEGTNLSLTVDYGDADSYTRTNVEWTTADGGATWHPASQMLWKSQTATANIYAYAPCKNGEENITAIPFSVQTDQSAGLISSDLVGYTKTSFNPYNGLVKQAIPIVFDHILSKLTVSCTLGNQFDGTGITISKVRLINTNNSAIYNVMTKAVNEVSEAYVQPIIMHKVSGSTTQWEAILVPQTVSAGTAMIEVQLSDGSVYRYTAPTGGNTFATGTAYTINLRVGKNKIEVVDDVTVGNWDNNSGAGNIIDGGEAIVKYIEVNGIKLATGNLIADGKGGCKIGAPEDGGLYFQFGSLVGWSGGANGDGTGRVTYNTQPALSVVVKPVSCNKHDNTWINNNNSNINTLSDFYFNYCLPPYETAGNDIRGFDVDIAGAESTGTLGSGRYAALGVGDPCSYYLGGKWRLPTSEEWETILGTSIDGDWSNTNGWSPKGDFDSTPSYAIHTSGLTILAAGLRAYDNGYIYKVDIAGSYWSSSVSDEFYGYSIGFILDAIIPPGDIYRSSGHPVRCVHE